MIDKKIQNDIKEINKFDFVETKLSCQGHFCKSKCLSFLYYGNYDKNKKEFKSRVTSLY